MKRRSIALLLALALMAGVMPAHAAAAPGQKLVAITFDDGPGPYTDGLLDELAKRGVVVTFFMQGYNASRYPAVIKKAYEAGHQIASHTYSHPQLTTLNNAGIQNELSSAANVLNSAIGTITTYMVRPPYGSTNARVLSALNAPAILWSVDTLDWQSRNPDAIFQHIVNDTTDGAIILMHDIHSTTIPGALRGIDYLLSQGYELVTVRELLRRRGYDAAPGTRYFSAPGNTTLPGITQPVIEPVDTAGGRLVSITADAGTELHYTIDGSTPTSQSALYTGPFSIKGSTTVKAFAALALNGARSKVSSATIADVPQLKAPVITLEDDLAVLSGDGEIHYTTDGTIPTENSQRYTGPVPLPAGTVIRAIAVQPGCRNSQVSSLLHSDLGNLFSDVQPSQWFYQNVDNVVAQGLMTTANRAFFPGRAVTRRDLVTVLYRMAGKPDTVGEFSIPDVTEADSAYAAIVWAVDQHVLSGYDDGSIRPNSSVTREQLATVLFRMHSESTLSDPSQMGLYAFEDWESVQSYALDAMEWAVASGILNGVSDTILAPRGTVTRAQLASIALRVQAL